MALPNYQQHICKMGIGNKKISIYIHPFLKPDCHGLAAVGLRKQEDSRILHHIQ